MDLELLVLGDKGWGDEMLRAALVTLMVSLAAMGIGLFISIIKVFYCPIYEVHYSTVSNLNILKPIGV